MTIHSAAPCIASPEEFTSAKMNPVFPSMESKADSKTRLVFLRLGHGSTGDPKSARPSIIQSNPSEEILREELKMSPMGKTKVKGIKEKTKMTNSDEVRQK
jgi:hypothetical protein